MTNDSSSILKVDNLAVEINNEKIIDDLSFDVQEGETFMILGPNGAGKTVLLKALLGILPYRGDIEWGKGTRIGYVPQRLPFIKDFPLTVREFFQLKNPKIDCTEALRSVGINDNFVQGKRIGILSSGQFQRILIAWGLIGDPQVLLFDEPTAGIDIGGEETIYTLLERLKKEKKLTIFLVTHDLNIIYREADKVLCLNHKKICYGLPKEVVTSQSMSQLFGSGVKFYTHQHD